MKVSMVIASALVLAGCASSNLKLSMADGSKADGTVELVASTGSMGTPTFDYLDADAQAAKACVNWGYQSAERLPSYRYRCSQYTCEYRVRYQCIQR